MAIAAEDLAALNRNVEDLFDLFKGDVVAGRGLDTAVVDAVSDGATHVGQRAVERGLADELATYEQVMAHIQEAHETSSATAEGKQGSTMTKNTGKPVALEDVTADQLQAARPDLVESLEKAAAEAAAKAERTRAAAILRLAGEHSAPADLAAKAIENGDSVETFAMTLLGALKDRPAPKADAPPASAGERNEARLDAIRGTTPEPSGNAGVSEFDEGNPASADAKAFADLPEGEEKWRLQFEKHGNGEESAEQLQQVYGDVEVYLADKRNTAPRGR